MRVNTPVNLGVVSYTQNQSIYEAMPILTTSATSGALLFGSSLFLQRLHLPGPINLSEVDMAFSFAMSTSASSASWGSLERTFAIYKFANSTSLALITSAAVTQTFAASNTTNATQGSLSQVVGGWTVTGGVINPMTFASTSFSAGDYVIGNIVALVASTSATITIFGAAATGLTLGSFLTASGSASVYSTVGTVAGSFHTASTSASVFSNSGTLAQILVKATVTTTASTTGSAASLTVFTAAPTVVGVMESGGLSAVTLATAAPTIAGVLSSSGLTSVYAMAAVGGVAFQYQGTGVSYTAGGGTTYAPFYVGIMNTGAAPANITLTTGTAASLTTYGATAQSQPWFALVGV